MLEAALIAALVALGLAIGWVCVSVLHRLFKGPS